MQRPAIVGPQLEMREMTRKKAVLFAIAAVGVIAAARHCAKVMAGRKPGELIELCGHAGSRSCGSAAAA